MYDMLIAALGVGVPGMGMIAVFGKKAFFAYKVIQQAVASFEDFAEENREIYNKIQADPTKKELAKVLAGGVRKIEGLTGLDIDGKP